MKKTICNLDCGQCENKICPGCEAIGGEGKCVISACADPEIVVYRKRGKSC